MRSKLPETLSVDDAVALIINLPYTPGGINPMQMLAYFTEESAAMLDSAKTPEDKELCRYQLKTHQVREQLAEAIYDLLVTEIDRVRKGKPDTLELAEDSIGSEKLVTASVCDWAHNKGFHIEGWSTPRHWRKKNERSYSTAYLDIVDDVIANFCEELGNHYAENGQPKKEAVMAWIKEKYPETSAKVNDAIATIIRNVPVGR
jgi:hypothetical protein